MSITPSAYTALITSEHADKPNFVATVAALVQPMVDQQNQMLVFSTLFDVDKAVGDQLDKIGLWIGVGRNLTQVISGVSTLDDATYRVLIKLYIGMNTWDGTVPGIYAIWNANLLQYLGPIVVVDNQDMTMNVYILSSATGLLASLITSGYFTMRPAGVGLSVSFFVTSVPGAPIFGFDEENAVISGFDVGAWAVTH